MKVRVGPRSTTLTLTDAERRALMDVLTDADEHETACAERESRNPHGYDPVTASLRRAIHDGRASFARRVRLALIPSISPGVDLTR